MRDRCGATGCPRLASRRKRVGDAASAEPALSFTEGQFVYHAAGIEPANVHQRIAAIGLMVVREDWTRGVAAAVILVHVVDGVGPSEGRKELKAPAEALFHFPREGVVVKIAHRGGSVD